MMKFVVLTTFLFLLLLQFTKADLDYNRVHVVDYLPASNAFLFRGNQPLKGPNGKRSFAYSELLTYMGKRAVTEAVNATWPSNPEKDVYLIDITFETIFDGGFIPEQDFWMQPCHQSQGQYLQWMLLGAPLWAQSLTTKEQIDLINSGFVWKTDMLPGRVQIMRMMLEKGAAMYGKKVLAIFVHCSAGCDRTGEFVGAYRMTYEYQPTLAVQYAKDITECGRAPSYFSSGMLGWYCLTWNMWNATAAQKPPLPDCLTAYNCTFLGSCQPTNI